MKYHILLDDIPTLYWMKYLMVSAVPRQTELAKVISECAGPEAAWRQLPKESAPREVGVRSGAGCRAFEERPFARGRNGECAIGGWGENVRGEN